MFSSITSFVKSDGEENVFPFDNIGKMPPSREFVSFYRDNLESAMRRETDLFFKHVLEENLHPVELLSADYSFINRELGEHYGISGLEGNEFC